MLASELVKVVPAVEAGIVPVVEDDAHGVVADALECLDRYVLFSGDKYLLLRSMAQHLGAGRFYTQVFGREPEGRAVVVADRQHRLGFVDAKLDRPGLRGL